MNLVKKIIKVIRQRDEAEASAAKAEEKKKEQESVDETLGKLRYDVDEAVSGIQSVLANYGNMMRMVQKSAERIKDHPTNNWKRMHGIPMRRKKPGQRRRR